jgi:hypothetical protein
MVNSPSVGAELSVGLVETVGAKLGVTIHG